MTDAGSIWESKLSRLQDPTLEKMKPLVELMGELRERRQERGEPPPMLQALRRAHSVPGGAGCSVDEAALIIDLISLLIGGTTLAVVLYQLYESKRRVEIDFSVELRHIAPWPDPMPTAIFWVTPLGKTRRGFTGCWYDIARGKRLVQFDSHSSAGLPYRVATGAGLESPAGRLVLVQDARTNGRSWTRLQVCHWP